MAIHLIVKFITKQVISRRMLARESSLVPRRAALGTGNNTCGEVREDALKEVMTLCTCLLLILLTAASVASLLTINANENWSIIKCAAHYHLLLLSWYTVSVTLVSQYFDGASGSIVTVV